ncbi:hypothetical protein HT031_005156 [Scenedesmus sp. PABB004]|nr:hypothetical protein HT031_005156 [Scenedesmus sp. PABB004]
MRPFTLLCLLFVAAGVARAADAPLAKGLAGDPDTRLWARLMDALGVRADAAATYATLLTPTDQAVSSFLFEMGLTFDDLLAPGRRVLVDALLSYHLVPGVAITDWRRADPRQPGRPLISGDPAAPTQMTTGDVDALLGAYVSPVTGLVTLLDAQGNRAVVVGPPRREGNLVFHDVSAVLMSWSYFFNAVDALRAYPQWSGASGLLAKAALVSPPLADSLIGKSEATFLFPSNDALEADGYARRLASAPSAQLAALMSYHVLPGLRPVPGGWPAGATAQTLLSGRSITAALSTSAAVDPYSGAAERAPLVTLRGDGGPRTANVTVMNIYAGKSIVQGINNILRPNDAALAPLFSGGGAAPASGQAGRHLLQRHRGGGAARSHANNWGAQNTQRAIRAAARGDIPVSYATRAGSRNAQLARGGCANCWRWGACSRKNAATILLLQRKASRLRSAIRALEREREQLAVRAEVVDLLVQHQDAIAHALRRLVSRASGGGVAGDSCDACPPFASLEDDTGLVTPALRAWPLLDRLQRLDLSPFAWLASARPADAAAACAAALSPLPGLLAAARAGGDAGAPDGAARRALDGAVVGVLHLTKAMYLLAPHLAHSMNGLNLLTRAREAPPPGHWAAAMAAARVTAGQARVMTGVLALVVPAMDALEAERAALADAIAATHEPSLAAQQQQAQAARGGEASAAPAQAAPRVRTRRAAAAAEAAEAAGAAAHTCSASPRGGPGGRPASPAASTGSTRDGAAAGEAPRRAPPPPVAACRDAVGEMCRWLLAWRTLSGARSAVTYALDSEQLAAVLVASLPYLPATSMMCDFLPSAELEPRPGAATRGGAAAGGC